MRRVSIFGATGSIGQNTLDLIRRDRAGYDVVALTGGANIPQLAHDAIELGAEIAVTAYPNRLEDLRAALSRNWHRGRCWQRGDCRGCRTPRGLGDVRHRRGRWS